MKFCPRCGAKVDPEDPNCTKCGKDLVSLRKTLYGESAPEKEFHGKERIEGDRSTAKARAQPKSVTCSFCGTPVPSGESRCRQCGTRVESQDPEASYPCASCGGELKFITTYQRWYCPRCGRYA
jgi:DNA-directed RNA polymerase subunit RPC12/RpoP